MKLAVITPIPTPYRDPFWNVVAALPQVDLDVYYCSSGKGDRPWGVSWERTFASEVLPGWNLTSWAGRQASCFLNPTIGHRLRAKRHDALIVSGYNHATMLMAIRFATTQGIPYFLMSESHL